jgi:16S rRNA (cytidine1402-2'-O)-methyltransferase
MSLSTPAGSKLKAGLWVVGTPIGNLEDVTARALETLRRADAVACEDTRTTARLLARYEIRARTLSYFEHSPEGRAREILSMIRGGAAVALVSEAGTPAVSDPGARLVAEAHREGLAVFAVPGPSAVTAALSVAGFAADRFVFEGFLPKRPGKRRRLLRELAEQERTLVFFESPHRIEAALADCVEAFGEGREGAIMREITKVHEEARRGTLRELLEAARSNPRGEFTVVIAGGRSGEA